MGTNKVGGVYTGIGVRGVLARFSLLCGLIGMDKWGTKFGAPLC